MASEENQGSGARPVRVAVWGIGKHAERRLLPALAACEATTIAGVTSRDADRGTRLAAAYGCPYWPRPEELLESDGVDAVLVATPIGCHFAHGRAVLAAGKHLWCEKSLTASASESAWLVAEAQRRALLLAEGFMFLYHPHFQRLAAAVAQVGEIVSMTARLLIPQLEEPGFRHAAALGGGGLLDVGCYPVQAAGELLGEGLVVDHARLTQPAGFEVDMLGNAVLTSPAGATAFLEWGFGASYRNEITVCGTTGSIDTDRPFSKTVDYAPSVCVRDSRGTLRSEAIAPTDSFVEMFRALAIAQHDPSLRGALYARAAKQADLLDRVRKCALRSR